MPGYKTFWFVWAPQTRGGKSQDQNAGWSPAFHCLLPPCSLWLSVTVIEDPVPNCSGFSTPTSPHLASVGVGVTLDAQEAKEYVGVGSEKLRKCFPENSAIGSWEVFFNSYWHIDFKVTWIFKLGERHTPPQPICVMYAPD